MKTKAKKAGWAPGRSDKIDHRGVSELVARQALKSAAERAVTSRLCTEAIDKILANHWLILPSREVKTQKHYAGKAPTVTFTAGSIDGDGVSYGTGTGTQLAREDMAGLTTKKRSGWTGNPVGRPRKATQHTKSKGRGAKIKRGLRFDAIPQPSGLKNPVDWGFLRLNYVDNISAVDLAERFNLRAETMRQRLSRARHAAAAEGHDLPK
jgi:hypothetical protein